MNPAAVFLWCVAFDIAIAIGGLRLIEWALT